MLITIIIIIIIIIISIHVIQFIGQLISVHDPSLPAAINVERSCLVHRHPNL